MKLTSEQQKIIDLINQLPDNLKENTVNIISQMHASTETTKKDLTDAMVSPTMNEKGKEMLEKYNATKKIVDEFHQFCLKLSEKEETDFWDKTALSILAINNLAIPLFNVWDKEVWLNNKSDDLIESFKTDALQLAVLGNFLSNVLEGKSLESFKNDLNVEIPKAIGKYNSKVCNNTTAQLDIMLDKNLINILIYTFNKLEKLKKYEEFTNKMWDNFVKEFKEKARNIEETDEDKAWFFEHLFNITYHTADFIENQKNNRNIIYNYNYNLLHNNFDLDKTAHYEFQFNHVDKSTTYSNLIYKLTEKLGIKKLKILIGKYLIKP